MGGAKTVTVKEFGETELQARWSHLGIPQEPCVSGPLPS